MIGITTRHPLILGLACGILPWLSTKYAPMSAALLVTGLLTGSGPSTWRLAPARALAQAVLSYGVLLAAWFAFFWIIWGSPRPQSPYGAMVQTTPWNLVFGAPGLLFDQEYGLLPYAPAYVLAATGLWVLWRAGGDRRALAVRVFLVFAALLGTVGAFRIWWGGSASPSRPIASGLLLLMLPIAAAFGDAAAGTARRAAQHLLLWLGLGIALQMGLAQDGFLLANGRDGTASLLEWWSPRWEVWSLVPSFIHHEAWTAIGHTLVWLMVAAACAIVLRRLRPLSPGAASLAASDGAGRRAVCRIADRSAPARGSAAGDRRPQCPAAHRGPGQLRHGDAPGGADLRPVPQGRGSRSGFQLHPDRHPRAASRTPAVARRAQRPLLAARWPLSRRRAVRRRRAAWRAAAVAAVRADGPARLDVDDRPGTGPWSTEFSLPVDAGFVGFRSARELERAIQAHHASRRSRSTNASRAASRAAGAGRGAATATCLVLFHDDWTVPGADGLLGARPTARPASPFARDWARTQSILDLELRADHAPNHVTLQAPGWIEELDLQPREPQPIELPPPARGVVSLTHRRRRRLRARPSATDIEGSTLLLGAVRGNLAFSMW